MIDERIEDLELLKKVYLRLYMDTHSSFYKSSEILSLYEKAVKEIFIIQNNLRINAEGIYILGHLN